MRRPFPLVLFAAAALTVTGCNTVLGIEKLTYDRDAGGDAAPDVHEGGAEADAQPAPVVLALSSGPTSVCAVRDDGTLWCWGSLFGVELTDTCPGEGSPPCAATPRKVEGLEGVRDVTVGLRSVCALLDDGTVRCWGDHQHGQLGVGISGYICGTDDLYPCETEPREVPGLAGVKQVALSSGTTRHFGCAVLDTGTVKCWGANDIHQLGGAQASQTCKDPVLGDIVVPCSTTPVDVPGLADVESVALSETHACALLKDKTMRCWGAAQFGQLGSDLPYDKCTFESYELGSTKTFELDCVGTPRPVAFLAGYAGTAEVALNALAFWGFGCARAHMINSLQCWGDDSAGQLGIASAPDQCSFVYEPDAGPVVTACARRPSPVLNLVNVQSVAAGNLHACAVVAGAPWCWGADFEHALGIDPPPDVCSLDDGSQIGCAMSPQKVSGIDGVGTMAPGLFHTCALRSDGSVWCWGSNGYGQLGDGSGVASRATPMPIAW